MDEEKKAQEEQEVKGEAKEAPVKEEQIESPIESMSLLDKSKETAERLEKANEQTKKLLDKQEKLLSEQALAGRSLAGGSTTPKEKEKKTDAEYARGLLVGDTSKFKE